MSAAMSILFLLLLSTLQQHVSNGILLQQHQRKLPIARFVDLRSDTVTKPSPAMRKAMFESEVGDDVFGEDPTINALEDRVAKMFGKEKALFFPTGTMANLAAVMSWCGRRGSEIILGESSHIHIFEQGGISQFGGVASHILPNNPDGTIDLDAIEASIRPDNIHFPTTELISIENTHNNCGGKVLPPRFVEALGWLSKKKNIPVHLDGARIWNAAAASKQPVSELVHSVDSVTACLSKGLGAPAGSMLIGQSGFITRAKRLRKALGGGMRQVGVLAAAGMQALDDFEAGLLLEDHRRAEILAYALNDIPGIIVNANEVQTNIIMVHIDNEIYNSVQFVEQLKERGVLALPRGSRSMRVVVHRDIDDNDIQYTINAFREVSAKFWTKAQQLLNNSPKESELLITSNDKPFHEETDQIVDAKFVEEVVVETDVKLQHIHAHIPEEPNNHQQVTTPEESEDEQMASDGFEEAEVYGMTVSSVGFNVVLKGSICGRCIVVPVPPVDPMMYGLDIDQVESSEAVTLLQLLQGIDMETHLPSSALAMKLGVETEKPKLPRVMIDQIGGKNNIKAFSATLCGMIERPQEEKESSPKEGQNDKLTDDAYMNTTLSHPPIHPSLPLPSTNDDAETHGEFSSIISSLTASSRDICGEDDSSNADEPLSVDYLTNLGKKYLSNTHYNEVQSKSAFEAIGLALRHNSTIEVKSSLFQDRSLSCRPEDVSSTYPKLLTAVKVTSPVNMTNIEEVELILEKLHRKLQEATRQRNEDMIATISEELSTVYKTAGNYNMEDGSASTTHREHAKMIEATTVHKSQHKIIIECETTSVD